MERNTGIRAKLRATVCVWRGHVLPERWPGPQAPKFPSFYVCQRCGDDVPGPGAKELVAILRSFFVSLSRYGGSDR